MNRTITASVLALTIGLTSLTATPVQAGNNDLNKLFAGAVALFIIGKAVENSKNAKANVSRQRPQAIIPPTHNHRLSRRLPQECYFTLRTQNATRGVYGKTCLNEIMRYASRLPQACADTIRVRYGRRAQVYGARCLRNHGYHDAFSPHRRTARRY